MKKSKLTLESLKIDPLVFFLGSEEEAEKAERAENARIEEVKNIINAPDFCGLAYNNKSFWESVTKSTRTGETFQHTFFYKDTPSYHTSFEEGKTDPTKFYREIAENSFFSNLKLTIYTL